MTEQRSIVNIQHPRNNKVVVLPDSHAHPDFDNNRYTALGNFLLEEKATFLLNIGDFADMPSLSSYDRGTRLFEGRRYHLDVEAALDAQKKLFAPIERYNKMCASNKKRKYKLGTAHCLGNHDDGRIQKVTNANPELHGVISVDNLQYNKYWDTVVPFKQVGMLNGVLFSHYFTSGVKGMPIGGENVGGSLLRKNLLSSIQGHAHTYDVKQMVRADGTKAFGMSCGCYTHPDMKQDWNSDTAHMWRNCITVLHNLNDGSFDKLEIIEQDYLLRHYT